MSASVMSPHEAESFFANAVRATLAVALPLRLPNADIDLSSLSVPDMCRMGDHLEIPLPHFEQFFPSHRTPDPRHGP